MTTFVHGMSVEKFLATLPGMSSVIDGLSPRDRAVLANPASAAASFLTYTAEAGGLNGTTDVRVTKPMFWAGLRFALSGRPAPFWIPRLRTSHHDNTPAGLLALPTFVNQQNGEYACALLMDGHIWTSDFKHFVDRQRVESIEAKGYKIGVAQFYLPDIGVDFSYIPEYAAEDCRSCLVCKVTDVTISLATCEFCFFMHVAVTGSFLREELAKPHTQQSFRRAIVERIKTVYGRKKLDEINEKQENVIDRLADIFPVHRADSGAEQRCAHGVGNGDVPDGQAACRVCAADGLSSLDDAANILKSIDSRLTRVEAALFTSAATLKRTRT